MTNRESAKASSAAIVALTFLLPLSLIQGASPLPAGHQDESGIHCSVDLSSAGIMKDIVSNALVLGIGRKESNVRAFLVNAESAHATGEDLLKAAAAHFDLEVSVLSAEVTKFKHCNCPHDPRSSGDEVDGAEEARSRETVKVSQFSEDVILHVVLHEMGHALVREFDLPVLGNEETMADAFATHYLTTYLPDRALAVLQARVMSLMIEARGIPREEWTVNGEHNSDARRAFQIASLAVAADAQKYAPIAASIGMSEREVRRSRDYGSEIHRSWRRILQPLWVPSGGSSTEAWVGYDEGSELLRQLCADGLTEELRAAIRRFDWHSQVKISFEEGEGGASWSRSKRTITVHSEYVRRFIEQGEVAARERAEAADEGAVREDS